jgi:hypothetical protein
VSCPTRFLSISNAHQRSRSRRRHHGYALGLLDTAGIHYRSRAWLAEQLEKNRGAKIVVVTHHAPSKRSLPPRFDDDLLSAAYASHLDELVEHSDARLWIHGHVHEQQDYMIGTTRVLCNPRGYPDEFNTSFAPDLLATV